MAPRVLGKDRGLRAMTICGYAVIAITAIVSPEPLFVKTTIWALCIVLSTLMFFDRLYDSIIDLMIRLFGTPIRALLLGIVLFGVVAYLLYGAIICLRSCPTPSFIPLVCLVIVAYSGLLLMALMLLYATIRLLIHARRR